MSTLPTALTEIHIPDAVKIRVVRSEEELFAKLSRTRTSYDGHKLFGVAFRQGGRLQFTTALPLRKLLEMTVTDRAQPQATVEEVMTRSNRPGIVKHGNDLKLYLKSTACCGEKFILPAFTLNHGVRWAEDQDAALPSVVLYILVQEDGEDGMATWPAVLLVPAQVKLDVTDGAHRRKSISDLIESGALMLNASAITLVFEDVRNDFHQDFADAGKAKPIGKSQQVAYDGREPVNKRARELVLNSPFLSAFVDATAGPVNLSVNSRKIWSLAAMRGFVKHVSDNLDDGTNPDQQSSVNAATAGAEDFFSLLAEEIPHLPLIWETESQGLKITDKEALVGPMRRKIRGGDISLRAIGVAIFARAFVFCAKSQVSHQEMAEKLATLDWFFLNREPPEPDANASERYVQAVTAATNSLWRNLLVVGEQHYRISAAGDAADGAWERIEKELFPGKAKERAAVETLMRVRDEVFGPKQDSFVVRAEWPDA